jgi:plastocyanin
MHTLRKILVALALVLVAMPLLGGTASAKEPHQRVLELRDACDQVSWGGICTKKAGSVSLDEFKAELTDGGHGAWWIRQREITLDKGDTVSAVNAGGIVHTFTEVAKFGKGCIDDWNVAVKETVDNCPRLPNGVPDFGTAFATAGAFPDGPATAPQTLSVGVHRFQCLVHPWMRSVVTVRAD